MTVAQRMLLVIAASMILVSSAVYAWHAQGHSDVGAIADRLLKAQHPRAAAQVRAILGPITLGQSGPWGDCVRSVSGPPGFSYTAHPKAGTPCHVFAASDALRRQMEDYVRNNWDQCPHGRRSGCHTKYHFTDVAVQRSRYQAGLVGVHDYDIVHAINAAIAVLRTPACSGPSPATAPVAGPGPFRFTCAQALMMLVHFVGDLHQPLHVGALYLAENGLPVDPDSSPAERARENATSTHGGNLLHFGTTDSSPELHGTWDETLADRPTDAELARIAPTTAPLRCWAELWAGESLLLAREVYRPLRFSPKPPGRDSVWTVLVDDHAAYARSIAPAQHARIINAGARLTAILAAIWPEPAGPGGPSPAQPSGSADCPSPA
jgi:hypothetical protein